ncbi:MAG: restriction endonuclease subunit S, partial [Terriglobia bacterium]
TRTSLRYLQIEDLRPNANVKYCEPFNCPRATKSDVVIAWDGANAGTVSCSLEGHIGSTLAILKPIESKALSPVFLSRFLQGNFDYLKKTATGATIPHVSKDALTALQIPIPPLAEQERIVKLLDEADELRKLRAQADRRTADLIPSLFHEMFGDPATNPKAWPVCPLGEFAEKMSDGPFGSNLKSLHYVEDGVRVVRLQNIGVGQFLDYDKAYISQAHFAKLSKHRCLPGDVLIGTLGDPNIRACVLPESISEALNKADCIQLRPDRTSAAAEYICWLLNLPETLKMASGMIHGQTRSRISMGRVRSLVVPLPPISLQRKFAARVSEIQAMEAEQVASRRRLGDLFCSLLHRAFQGEL